MPLLTGMSCALFVAGGGGDQISGYGRRRGGRDRAPSAVTDVEHSHDGSPLVHAIDHAVDIATSTMKQMPEGLVFRCRRPSVGGLVEAQNRRLEVVEPNPRLGGIRRIDPLEESIQVSLGAARQINAVRHAGRVDRRRLRRRG